jgi:hypothetical protein
MGQCKESALCYLSFLAPREFATSQRRSLQIQFGMRHSFTRCLPERYTFFLPVQRRVGSFLLHTRMQTSRTRLSVRAPH